ncbi:MAG: sialate O-acetylesterase [Defluviitaleaceae bacterium]|nr:sialate O-acetylesterase [Defluviitaleaceae bacterium]
MLKDFTKETFDVIIQAGQSNSQGCGLGKVGEPYAVSESVYQMDGDFTVFTAREEVWGNEAVANFSLPFAAKYLGAGLLKNGRKLLILRTAVGGTGFGDKRWGPNDDLFLRMMEMIKASLELNPSNKLKALLWHQGETDVGQLATYEEHYKNLSRLVAMVRETYGEPKLPFVAGDFVKHWESVSETDYSKVLNAMRDVCANIGCAAFVETDGLTSNDQAVGNGDNIHFSREGIYGLGWRYFEAYMKCV